MEEAKLSGMDPVNLLFDKSLHKRFPNDELQASNTKNITANQFDKRAQLFSLLQKGLALQKREKGWGTPNIT